MNFVLYYCRLPTGYHNQDFDDLVHLMNEHFTKDVSQETLFPLDNLWITNEKDTKPYIHMLRSQGSATSIIDYEAYLDNIFALENFAITSINNSLMS